MAREFGHREQPKVVSSQLISRCEGAEPQSSIPNELPKQDKTVSKNIIVEVWDTGRTTPIGCDFYQDGECQIPEEPISCKYDTPPKYTAELKEKTPPVELKKIEDPIDVPTMDDFRRIIIDLREDNNLSVVDFSKATGIGEASVLNAETGTRGKEQKPTEIGLYSAQRLVNLYDAELGLKITDGIGVEQVEYQEDIRDKLYQRRRVMSLSRKKVAEEANLEEFNIIGLEQKKAEPRMKTIIEVANALKTTVEIRPRTQERPDAPSPE